MQAFVSGGEKHEQFRRRNARFAVALSVCRIGIAGQSSEIARPRRRGRRHGSAWRSGRRQWHSCSAMRGRRRGGQLAEGRDAIRRVAGRGLFRGDRFGRRGRLIVGNSGNQVVQKSLQIFVVTSG